MNTSYLEPHSADRNSQGVDPNTESNTRWKERLSGLSFERQSQIAKKYYGGKYPWKDSLNEKTSVQ